MYKRDRSLSDSNRARLSWSITGHTGDLFVRMGQVSRFVWYQDSSDRVTRKHVTVVVFSTEVADDFEVHTADVKHVLENAEGAYDVARSLAACDRAGTSTMPAKVVQGTVQVAHN